MGGRGNGGSGGGGGGSVVIVVVGEWGGTGGVCWLEDWKGKDFKRVQEANLYRQ